MEGGIAVKVVKFYGQVYDRESLVATQEVPLSSPQVSYNKFHQSSLGIIFNSYNPIKDVPSNYSHHYEFHVIVRYTHLV